MADNKDKAPQEIRPELARAASEKAKDRARGARWDLNIAIFLFAVLILVIILTAYTRAGVEVVAPVAVIGLALVWLVGRRRENQLYNRFYKEELANAGREEKETKAVKETIEETIEQQVQKALRERWQR